MYSKIYSGTALGIDGMIVTVETDISSGLPGLSLVGYLASSVKEAGERVRTALKNLGYSMPSRRITVNLSPADIRKDGAGYDMAIALGILISMEDIPVTNNMFKDLEETLFIGELGLDGRVLPVKGVLPIVDYAPKEGIRRVVLPEKNADEASFVKGVDIIPVSSFEDIIEMLSSGKWSTPYKNAEEEPEVVYKNDLADVKGQDSLKRGIIIAVSGFHNIIMTGAAGSGKSMIAKCIPSIMPPLTHEESMELTKIYSVAGLLNDKMKYVNTRPFRSLNQNISQVALLGGGHVPKPGEVSLATGGVLFLDEFPEFGRNIIESLRMPMEDHIVSISRAKASLTFPARFMLVSARNNCPCGFYPDRKKCKCTSREIYNYQNRISHPIMDRIDLRLEVSPVKYSDIFSLERGISSAEAREIIQNARERQRIRYKNEDFLFNSELPQGKISTYIKLSKSEEDLLRDFFENSDVSARGYYRIMKLVRTIADVEDREEIRTSDIEEAIFYRNETVERGTFI